MARRAQQRIPLEDGQVVPRITDLARRRRSAWEVMTSSEAIMEWRRYAREINLAPLTARRYESSILEWAAFLASRAAGDTTEGLIAAATRIDVQDWLDHLQHEREIIDKRDGKRYHAPLSPSGRKNALSAVRHLYHAMMHHDPNWSHDPTQGVTRPDPKVVKSLQDVLTRDELKTLLDYDKGNPRPQAVRQRVITYLLAYTGCRIQEIADLRWEDVSLTHSIITVVGKGEKERQIDMLPPLKIVLAVWQTFQLEWAERNADLHAALNGADPSHKLVLLTDRGKKMAQSSLWRTLKRRAHNAGVRALHPGKDGRGRTKDQQSEVHPHMLRKTLATILLEEGVHLDAVADILGHADTATTRRHYTNPRNDRRREAMEKFRIA